MRSASAAALVPKSRAKETAIVYTDGTLRGSMTEGAWAWIRVNRLEDSLVSYAAGKVLTRRGHCNATELQAIAQAVIAHRRFGTIVVRSDSLGSVEKLKKLLSGRGGTPEGLSDDDVQVLRTVAARRDVRLQWVRGHNGDFWNGAADRLAAAEASSKNLEKFVLSFARQREIVAASPAA